VATRHNRPKAALASREERAICAIRITVNIRSRPLREPAANAAASVAVELSQILTAQNATANIPSGSADRLPRAVCEEAWRSVPSTHEVFIRFADETGALQ